MGADHPVELGQRRQGVLYSLEAMVYFTLAGGGQDKGEQALEAVAALLLRKTSAGRDFFPGGASPSRRREDLCETK